MARAIIDGGPKPSPPWLNATRVNSPHAMAGASAPHHQLAEGGDLVARYPPEVSHFGGFPEPPEPRHWEALEELVGPGGVLIVTGHVGDPPAEAAPAGQ